MVHLTHYGITRCVKCGEGPIQVTLTSFSIHHSDIFYVVAEAPINQSRICRVRACSSNFATAHSQDCVYCCLNVYTNKRIDTSFCTVVLNY